MLSTKCNISVLLLRSRVSSGEDDLELFWRNNEHNKPIDLGKCYCQILNDFDCISKANLKSEIECNT